MLLDKKSSRSSCFLANSMEKSTSGTSHSGVKANNKIHAINVNQHQDDVTTFGSLSSMNLSNSADDEVVFASESSSSLNADVTLDIKSRSSLEKLRETGILEEEKKVSSSSPMFDNCHVTQQVVNGATDWASTSSVTNLNNIWTCPNFYDREDTTPENLLSGERSSITPLNHIDMNYVPDDYYGSLGDQTRVNSFYTYSSAYYSAYQFNGNSGLNYSFDLNNLRTNVMNGTGNCSPMMVNHFVNDQFWENMDVGYYNCLSNNYLTSPHYLQDHNLREYGTPQLENLLPGFDFLAMATSPEDSDQLRRVLEQGDYRYTKATLKGVFPSIFQLMTDPRGQRIFEMLVDKCENCELYAIVSKVNRESDSFLDAAYCIPGSRSIRRLIKRLKRTRMEFIITALLSRRSYELMTHKIGSQVIQQCFKVLGDKPNQVLYDEILSYFRLLATDPVGCIVVNECIDCITGPRRAVLLNLVVHYASHLSNDPSGNFVVQHVLALKNDVITERICYCLEGEYVQLAQKRGGSHVVEKCLRSSQLGLTLVVKEILDSDKVLLLARNQYGNYVLQTALKLTKDFAGHLYQALVKALEPHYSNLLLKTRGQHVINLIKDDLECQ